MTEKRRLGGILALRETWCRPDETVLWCCEGAEPRFDVPGLRPDGAVGKKRSALDTAINVVDFVASDNFSGSGPPQAPAVIATGPSAHCEAARMAYTAAAEPGLWVLTSHRLAYVAPVPDPAPATVPQSRGLLGKLREKADNVRGFITGGPWYADDEPVPVRRQRSVFEIHTGGFTVIGTAVRDRPRFTDPKPLYEKVALPDGSLLEFYAGPGGGRLFRTRQTGRLLLLDEQDR
ncbi:hypothetical protein AB0I28_13205 [Phytomonospora sp. NPDC050363]|uniref:hypothetical protein n=1 Tax=Phytomonospora sp. NPDC050363 TaxID=3155642 RepID=UPI0033CB3756